MPSLKSFQWTSTPRLFRLYSTCWIYYDGFPRRVTWRLMKLQLTVRDVWKYFSCLQTPTIKKIVLLPPRLQSNNKKNCNIPLYYVVSAPGQQQSITAPSRSLAKEATSYWSSVTWQHHAIKIPRFISRCRVIAKRWKGSAFRGKMKTAQAQETARESLFNISPH